MPPLFGASSQPPPMPVGSRTWSLGALSRAIDGAVLLVSDAGHLDFVSGSAADLLGTEAEFDERWEWIQARIDERVQRDTLLETGEASLELELPKPLGGRCLAVRLFPVEEEECAGYLAVLKDRRVLDALQADLHLAAQMRRIAATLQQATHDISAPLNAIKINLDIIKQELASLEASAPVRTRMGTVESELGRLARMVQSLLSHATVSQGRSRRFELRRLVREVAALLRPQAQSQGVSLDIDLPDVRVDVLGVRDYLKQALINLMVNAFEAMPDGGRVEVTLTPAKRHMNLRVRDTGPGIPPAIRGQVGRLHFTTKQSGTGIGLFTARATIHSMGGTLALQSPAGQGTTALIRLPRPTPPGGTDATCSMS